MENKTNNLIPFKDLPNENEIVVSDIKVTYLQKSDGNDVNDIQELNLSTSDNGGGTYFIIETERWAFDDLNDLINIFNDFKQRFSEQ